MKLKSIFGLAAVAVISMSVNFAQAGSKVQDLTLVQEKGTVVADAAGFRHGGFHHGGHHHHHHQRHHGHHGHHGWAKPASDQG